MDPVGVVPDRERPALLHAPQGPIGVAVAQGSDGRLLGSVGESPILGKFGVAEAPDERGERAPASISASCFGSPTSTSFAPTRVVCSMSR